MVNEILSKIKKNKIKFIYNNLKNINNYLSETNILVNTTPMGMKNFKNLEIDLNFLNKNALVYDLIYNPSETKLIKQAKKLKIKNLNGLRMLIYQAEKAFFYWFGKKPEIFDIERILKNKIK